jgi:DNA-binding transcriptional regulator YhcF (GntR family)
MEYKSDKPIYLQIADYICNQIVQNHWQENERILSVRELSVLLCVNPNTVVRSFENVEQHNIIYNKRGIGYFVSADAKQKILEIYKKEFFEELLPEVFERMKLYDIKLEEINKIYLDTQ